MQAIEFSIHYSEDQGFEADALSLARRLYAVYDTGIDALRLAPSQTERFALYFNDELVCSLDRDGRPPAVADIRAVFLQRGIAVARRPGPEEGFDES